MPRWLCWLDQRTKALCLETFVVELEGTSETFDCEATEGFQSEARVGGFEGSGEGFFGDRFASALGDRAGFDHREDGLGGGDEFLGRGGLSVWVWDAEFDGGGYFSTDTCVVGSGDSARFLEEGEVFGLGFQDGNFGAVFLGGEEWFATAGLLTTSHACGFFQVLGEFLAESGVPRTVEGLAGGSEQDSGLSEKRFGFVERGWD